MSMILKEISDFTVNAFHKDHFTTVTKKDILGNKDEHIELGKKLAHKILRA